MRWTRSSARRSRSASITSSSLATRPRRLRIMRAGWWRRSSGPRCSSPVSVRWEARLPRHFRRLPAAISMRSSAARSTTPRIRQKPRDGSRAKRCGLPEPAQGACMSHPIKAVLFDWGETLVLVPNMFNTVERHIACLEQIYFEPDSNGRPALLDYGVPWPRFRDAYVEATRTHIKRSQETRREHRFEDRFVHALQLAGAT